MKQQPLPARRYYTLLFKNSVLLCLLCSFFSGYSQHHEAQQYLREELVRQRDEHIEKVKELQQRIDAIDQQLHNTHTQVHYLSKTTSDRTKKTTNAAYHHANKSPKKYTSARSKTYRRGPRGGCYYINRNGNKTYVARSKCN